MLSVVTPRATYCGPNSSTNLSIFNPEWQDCWKFKPNPHNAFNEELCLEWKHRKVFGKWHSSCQNTHEHYSLGRSHGVAFSEQHCLGEDPWVGHPWTALFGEDPWYGLPWTTLPQKDPWDGLQWKILHGQNLWLGPQWTAVDGMMRERLLPNSPRCYWLSPGNAETIR